MRIACDSLQQCRGSRERSLFGTVRQWPAREFTQFSGIRGMPQTLVSRGQRLEIRRNLLALRLCGFVLGIAVLLDFSIGHSFHLTSLPSGIHIFTGRLEVPVFCGVTVALNVSTTRDSNCCDCSCGTTTANTMRSVYCASACSPCTEARRF